MKFRYYYGSPERIVERNEFDSIEINSYYEN